MDSIHTKKSLVAVLGVALILAVGVLAWKYGFGRTEQNIFSSQKVEIKKQTSFLTGNAKLPKDFPKEIPVEVENLVTSEVLVYPERKVTLYSVSYNSTKPSEELTELYKSFLNKTTYILHLDTFGKRVGSSIIFKATSAPSDLTVMITPQAGQNMVQISYLVRN